MIEPLHPTEDQIRRRIEFHQAGEYWYRKNGQTDLADWSKERVAEWQAKLPARAAVASGSTETGDCPKGAS